MLNDHFLCGNFCLNKISLKVEIYPKAFKIRELSCRLLKATPSLMLHGKRDLRN